MNRIRNTLAVLAMLCTLALAVPAAAQAEASFCGLDKMPTGKLAELHKMFGLDQPKEKLFDRVDKILDECSKKVDKATAAKPGFRGFVFGEALTFSARSALVAQGYDMDKFDAAAALRCNHELISSDQADSDETTVLLRAAIKAAGANPDALSQGQTVDFYSYAAGSAMRWREGQELGLLAACKV
ncbi:MAG: hypothetical protein WBL74_03590 [Novosphingobium sp.]|uniref:hypothetical protein n=1 Tax=Novosphingobium sp. TaxID=1874826 RepID=UPI003C7E8CB7